MAGGVFTLSSEDLDRIVAERVADALTSEALERIAEKHIAERCARLTLDEAARHLRCPNRVQLLEFCRQHRIPIIEYSQKKKFILLRDLEAADAHRASLPPARDRKSVV